MSATRISQVAGPSVKESMRGVYPSAAQRGRGLRPLGARFRREVDGRAHADVVEMRGEEIARRAPPALVQHLEEIIVRLQLRSGGELLEGRVERDAMHVDAAVFARAGAVRQA